MSEHRVVRYAVTVVLEFFRGMPVLLMMLFIYLIFPIGPYWSVVTALTLYNGAIIGEALRSGILGLPRGQREAGLAIGLRPLQNRLLVEFPQAFRTMLPIIVAQLVVSLVGLTKQGELILEATSRANSLPIFVVMVGMYLVLNLTVSTIARRLARKRGPRVAKTVAAGTSQGA
jgi:glutamate transport system permease protein